MRAIKNSYSAQLRNFVSVRKKGKKLFRYRDGIDYRQFIFDPSKVNLLETIIARGNIKFSYPYPTAQFSIEYIDSSSFFRSNDATSASLNSTGVFPCFAYLVNFLKSRVAAVWRPSNERKYGRQEFRLRIARNSVNLQRGICFGTLLP